MPSHKEFYDALKNISVNADTLNLNTDQVESKLDTATGLLTTLSADAAIIKNDMANGVAEPTDWVQIGVRDWKANSSNWYLDVSGYASIRLVNNGDASASMGNGFWVAGQYDLCENDPIIWNGKTNTASIPIADCSPLYEANVKSSWVRFVGSEPSLGGSSAVYGKKTKILDGLTNYQLRASPVEISGTVNVGNSITIGTMPAISGTVTANLSPLKTSPTFLTGTMTATSLTSVIPAGTRNYLRIQAMEGGSGSALLFVSFNGVNDHAVLQTSVLQTSATAYPYAISSRSDTLEFSGSWVPQTEVWIRSSSASGKPYSIIYA